MCFSYCGNYHTRIAFTTYGVNGIEPGRDVVVLCSASRQQPRQRLGVLRKLVNDTKNIRYVFFLAVLLLLALSLRLLHTILPTTDRHCTAGQAQF